MARITDAQAKDLDETRRLLYMALVAGQTKRYNLAGTVVNAIKHHQDADIEDSPDGCASPALIAKVVSYVEGSAPEGDTFVHDQIRRIIAALE